MPEKVKATSDPFMQLPRPSLFVTEGYLTQPDAGFPCSGAWYLVFLATPKVDMEALKQI